MSFWKRLFGKSESQTATSASMPPQQMLRPPAVTPPIAQTAVSTPATSSADTPPSATPESSPVLPPIAPDLGGRREIRVFISSTFRDMMKERDLLVKEIFPALRRKCAKRFVTFTEVDLRWGITEDQANEGQVLPLCLAEIQRCRPYFLGLLGERYGWIPESIRPEVIEREPWLTEHVRERTSVTELEILHGVLNDPAMKGLAFFYFRDPAYVIDPSLTARQRLDMLERNIATDVKAYGEAEATRRTQERKGKLAALKQRIRDSKLPLMEPYANPEALAKLVHDHLDKLIDDLYPEAAVPDPLTQERRTHEAHAKNKLIACIDRPIHRAALDAFADLGDNAGKGLVITGESGGGKTALLAAWARTWQQANQNDFLFQHYFGATPDSSSTEGFLRRLLGELKQRFRIADPIPADPKDLREALPLWLAQVPSHTQMLLVLDGLNQIQGSDTDRHLNFLPRQLPRHITVVASALPGPALDALRQRGWTEHDLPRATEAEVDAMVGEYFQLLGRHVDEQGHPIQTPLRRQLVAAPGAKNPLFLRTVLEELRQFGDFDTLPQRVASYLVDEKTHEPIVQPQALFQRVIQRWQEDFDRKDAPGLVRHALTHLWAARQGLSEPEWLDLLGKQGEPLPRALWTALFLALEPHLSQREGLYAFGHDFLRQAVEAAFVGTPKLQQAAHLAIADYFEHHAQQREMTPRKAAEWPEQLHRAQSWDRLEACLTDIPLFLALYNERAQWELTSYWHPLRKLGKDMGGCYRDSYDRWVAVPANTDNGYVPNQLGQFLHENAEFSAAEPLMKRVVSIFEKSYGPDHPNVATALNNLAQLFRATNRLAEAEPLMKRVVSIFEKSYGPEHPDVARVLNNLAGLLQATNRLAEAEPLMKRHLEIILKSTGATGHPHPHLQAAIGNYAGLLQAMGQSREQIVSTLQELGRRYGVSLGKAGGVGRGHSLAQTSGSAPTTDAGPIEVPGDGREAAK